MKALITSGGKGTRLRPITHTQNKHLIPIGNKLMLQYAIEAIRDAGITDIGILVNADSDDVQNAFGSGENSGVRLTYIPQDAPLGLAHVVKISQEFLGDEPFIFYLGDNMLVGGVKKFIDEFKANGSNCHLTLARVPDPSRFGVPELDGNRIVRIVEKPQQPMSPYAVAGIYIYDKSIFDAVNNIQPSARGELEISDAHQYLLDHGYKVTWSEITGWWKDTGKPEDLLEANRLILENAQGENAAEIAGECHFSGRIIAPASVSIQNSKIRGPVIIGENVKIENAYIGPFTSIGNHCFIRNSEVEFSILLDGVTIHDLDVRLESSLIGANSTVIRSEEKPVTNRVIIGDHSFIKIV